MSKICYFYATNEDHLTITARVESAQAIKYTRCGQITVLPPEVFKSASEIPNLGMGSHPSAVGCEHYLVCRLETSIKPRPLKTLTEEAVNQIIALDKEPFRALVGVKRYAVDQLSNPDTICLSPGGFWKDQMLCTEVLTLLLNRNRRRP